jgi:hypothetical protein
MTQRKGDTATRGNKQNEKNLELVTWNLNRMAGV